MNKIDELLLLMDRLLGPDGCPWDQKQTFYSLQTYLLEEAYELIEAMDRESRDEIVEELGDVLFTIIFIAKLGEKEKLFSFQDSVQCICEKLIRRHPHIFANVKIESVDDVLKNWESIKKKEKNRPTIFDGIPTALPQLARAQKIVEKLKRSKHPMTPDLSPGQSNETEIGQKLWDLVIEAQRSGIDAESALRRFCQQMEKKIIATDY